MSYMKADETTIEDTWMDSVISLVEEDTQRDQITVAWSMPDAEHAAKRGRMSPVSFKLPAPYLEMVDHIAEQTGMTRSAYLRGAIEHALTKR